MNIKTIINFIKGTSKQRESNEKPNEKSDEKPDEKIRNEQMTKKTSPPSINKTAFDCPHCGVLTTQYWFSIKAKQMDENYAPFIPNQEWATSIKEDPEIPKEQKQNLLNWYDDMCDGFMFLDDKETEQWCKTVNHLYISKCYDCEKITLWVNDNIVFPPEKQEVPPNQDLPDDIIKDFEEARSIVGLSPRGTAALLRLCIQKLCKFLGEKGKKIDDDIASLVAKGLNPLVQQSLDIVRVIGSEAVHPGVINLNDNRDIANKLFALINFIADQMITHPKNVKELYEKKLPESKRKHIEERNGKAEK